MFPETVQCCFGLSSPPMFSSPVPKDVSRFAKHECITLSLDVYPDPSATIPTVWFLYITVYENVDPCVCTTQVYIFTVET